MKRLLLVLLAVLSISTLPVIAGGPVAGVLEVQHDPATVTVYITKTGEKYHADGCQHLRRSKIPVSLKEAVAKGFEPCSVCKPPRMAKAS
jgi:hypothetical protein